MHVSAFLLHDDPPHVCVAAGGGHRRWRPKVRPPLASTAFYRSQFGTFTAASGVCMRVPVVVKSSSESCERRHGGNDDRPGSVAPTSRYVKEFINATGMFTFCFRFSCNRTLSMCTGRRNSKRTATRLSSLPAGFLSTCWAGVIRNFFRVYSQRDLDKPVIMPVSKTSMHPNSPVESFTKTEKRFANEPHYGI